MSCGPIPDPENGLRHFAVGRPPARKPRGNRRYFAFWIGTGALDPMLREYSGDPDAPAKVRAMPLAEQFAYAERIGLITDDGTGIY